MTKLIISKKKSLFFQNKGYLLIESIIAISIIVVGILGVLNLLSRSIGLNQMVNDQFIGNYLAAEGIEIVKNIIDSNIINGNPWNSGLSSSKSFEVDYRSNNLLDDNNSYLLFNPDTNFYSYEKGSQTRFIRTIKIVPVGMEEIKVNSIVKWDIKGVKFEINLEDHFFNWRSST
ncbi:hypothetical protein JW698_01655 [Candidatus Wolfebacteria bacterium]|nr:hypothetical protein [Candidatus Wolfebacteria bacterium]